MLLKKQNTASEIITEFCKLAKETAVSAKCIVVRIYRFYNSYFKSYWYNIHTKVTRTFINTPHWYE